MEEIEKIIRRNASNKPKLSYFWFNLLFFKISSFITDSSYLLQWLQLSLELRQPLDQILVFLDYHLIQRLLLRVLLLLFQRPVELFDLFFDHVFSFISLRKVGDLALFVLFQADQGLLKRVELVLMDQCVEELLVAVLTSKQILLFPLSAPAGSPGNSAYSV